MVKGGHGMIHKIKSVRPLENLMLSVVFQNGTEKRFDLHNLFSAIPQLKMLANNTELFNQVHVDAGGYGIVWNDDLDLNAEDIWEDGVEV